MKQSDLSYDDPNLRTSIPQEERAKRLAEMAAAADEHEGQRWARLKAAEEKEKAEGGWAAGSLCVKFVVERLVKSNYWERVWPVGSSRATLYAELKGPAQAAKSAPVDVALAWDLQQHRHWQRHETLAARLQPLLAKRGVPHPAPHTPAPLPSPQRRSRWGGTTPTQPSFCRRPPGTCTAPPQAAPWRTPWGGASSSASGASLCIHSREWRGTLRVWFGCGTGRARWCKSAGRGWLDCGIHACF